MAEASIPVDLFNPGQVFACLGFVEAADVLLGDAEGIFDWSEPGQVRFHLRARGDESPVVRVLRFLDAAQVKAVAPAGSASIAGWLETWGPRPELLVPAAGYPFPDPSSPATLVCILHDGDHELTLDHWGDATERDNVKFWAGSRGYPGAALARDALVLVKGKCVAHASAPFALSASQTSSFRLDWRRDYVPIDLGFSLNEHPHVEAQGFPLVEILGALGLTHGRPRRPSRRDKLVYEYAVPGTTSPGAPTLLPPSLLRAALGLAPLPFPLRRFRMLLDWPGQENQARAITTVTEETVP